MTESEIINYSSWRRRFTPFDFGLGKREGLGAGGGGGRGGKNVRD